MPSVYAAGSDGIARLPDSNSAHGLASYSPTSPATLKIMVRLMNSASLEICSQSINHDTHNTPLVHPRMSRAAAIETF